MGGSLGVARHLLKRLLVLVRIHKLIGGRWILGGKLLECLLVSMCLCDMCRRGGVVDGQLFKSFLVQDGLQGFFVLDWRSWLSGFATASGTLGRLWRFCVLSLSLLNGLCRTPGRARRG